jgi:hypothetical protein
VLATCNAGEQQISNSDPCPSGYACHTKQVCCQSIQCANKTDSASGGAAGGSAIYSGGNCAAMPACDSGDVQTPNGCPPGVGCYSRSMCGVTIVCQQRVIATGGASSVPTDAGASVDAGQCNPATEYNRHYAATSTTACMVIDFACQSQTNAFFNECGCGCEQASSCPEWVDCMPGPVTLNPLCSNDNCPFTLRAL